MLLAIIAWYVWSMKQRFALKRDMQELERRLENKVDKSSFKAFKNDYYHKSEDSQIRLIKIETHMENISNSIFEMKEFLFKGKKKD